MYSRDDAKVRAKKLRTILQARGHDITHALEVVAQQSNYKDWNILAPTLDDIPVSAGPSNGSSEPVNMALRNSD